jgi:hypothetical protein
MLYGEHLNVDEQSIACHCGVAATVEVHDKHGGSCGWFCRKHAAYKRDELKRQEKLAKAIVWKGRP